MMVFSVLGSLISIVFALLSQRLVDSAVEGNASALALFATALLCAIFVQVLIRSLEMWWRRRVTASVTNGYRERMFGCILDRDLGQIGSFNSGELMNRMTEDVRVVVQGVCSFLLLDEATSALDEETEARLLANLRGMADRTVLIVTHRRAALDIVDKTYMLSR